MRIAICGVLLLLAVVLGEQSQAQGCGGAYMVRAGDTLTMIAESQYGDAGKWTAIHSVNTDQIGSDPNNLRAGMRLRLRCIDGRPVGLEGAGAASALPVTSPAPLVVAPGNAASRGKINILTGGDFWPFIDKAMDNGGMLTDVVQAAMQAANRRRGLPFTGSMTGLRIRNRSCPTRCWTSGFPGSSQIAPVIPRSMNV